MLDDDLEKEINFRTIREICWHWCDGHSENWSHKKSFRCVLRKKAWCRECLKLLMDADEEKKHRRFQPVEEGSGIDPASEPTDPLPVEPQVRIAEE